jgi:beta-fructofuranosidase
MEARKALFPQVKSSRWRQRWHFMAPAGWINDPNGCVYYNGAYHLFYQHNPYSGHWSAMHWGHAISTDLVHWAHLPIALAPSETYDNHPDGGIFSGSTVINSGELVALYTATTANGTSFVQTQCLAASTDGGITFQKYDGNPVIMTPPDGASMDFRDPKVIRHGDCWYMVLGASLGKGAKAGGEGCCMMYASHDLRHWDYCGIIARSGEKLGTMWECPDLFQLNNQWALTFSPMFSGNKTAVCLIGDMDFRNAKFQCRHQSELDWGGDYYAVQSMRTPDGRVVLMAWQNGWDWMPNWKGFGPMQEDGWCGHMAIPRNITFDNNNRIISQPVSELQALRRDECRINNLSIGAEPFSIPCADLVCFEIEMEIDLTRTKASCFSIDLRANAEYRTRLVIDFTEKKLILDKSRSDDGISAGTRECPLVLDKRHLNVRVFSDTISVEVFADSGKACMSANIYPTHKEQGIFLSADTGVVSLTHVRTWRLDAIEEESNP